MQVYCEQDWGGEQMSNTTTSYCYMPIVHVMPRVRKGAFKTGFKLDFRV
jgi:hypothetical protein